MYLYFRFYYKRDLNQLSLHLNLAKAEAWRIEI
jgi:hypothetical protein